jgi:hypothetical protein
MAPTSRFAAATVETQSVSVWLRSASIAAAFWPESAERPRNQAGERRLAGAALRGRNGYDARWESRFLDC